jgi:hypothetical protein
MWRPSSQILRSRVPHQVVPCPPLPFSSKVKCYKIMIKSSSLHVFLRSFYSVDAGVGFDVGVVAKSPGAASRSTGG